MLVVTLVLFCLSLVFLIVFLILGKLSLAKGQYPEKTSVKSPENKVFVISPYLQLGNKPSLTKQESLELLWFTKDTESLWSAEIRALGAKHWIQPELPQEKTISIDSLAPLKRFQVRLNNLPAGEAFEYRILRDGHVVFSSKASARKSELQPHRFIAVGDLASGSKGARKIAHQMWLSKPDIVVVAGDHVYKHGRLSEYLDHYYPIYNHEQPDPDKGSPLLRSTPVVVAFGNHDAGTPDLWDVRDLDKMPDLLAFFIVLSQPLNGPIIASDTTCTPDLRGSEKRKEDFLKAAGENFPRMTNFSFDYGNVHWLVLDANCYMDWTNPYLRTWVENDLMSTKSTWKFVVFHQPAFSSDVKHRDEQRMRLLVDVFERCGVDVVFSGHNHAYERNYPLHFTLSPLPDGKKISPEGRVSGTFVLDKNFDGQTKTKPDGIMYLVTGGGGGKLSLEPTRRADHLHLPPFTFKLVDDIHSFTVCDVSGKTLLIRQISEDGDELDRFMITK